MESSGALQSGEGGPIAGPSTSLPVHTMPIVSGVTVNQGDVNTAGRDVNVNIIHNHYPSYPDKVDITAILGAIRNLRTIHSDNLSKATPGTGVWFFKTKMFLMWLDPNGHLKIIWGTGIREWNCNRDPDLVS
ncbi:hypothetical protein BKA70DRAFT_373755 [Coprinopsis sp. MPI-PUGE-AT-0042]|nr:hypothetical protein BKA70DRAFT_373755 [Coprinopsis sp. MPI-PUGE-AT-0042]